MNKIKKIIVMIGCIVLLTSCQKNEDMIVLDNSPKVSNISTEENWSKKYDFENLKSKGIDVKKLLEDVTEIDNIEDIQIELNKCNFSHNDVNYWNDIILSINVNTGYEKTDFSLLCVFENSEDNYNLLFSKSVKNLYYRCFDINGDFINEIIIEETEFGGRTESEIFIYKRNDNKFDVIFNEGLMQIYADESYYYINTYKFIKNKKTDCYDIILSSVIYDDEQNRGNEFSTEKNRVDTEFVFKDIEYVAENKFEYR